MSNRYGKGRKGYYTMIYQSNMPLERKLISFEALAANDAKDACFTKPPTLKGDVVSYEINGEAHSEPLVEYLRVGFNDPTFDLRKAIGADKWKD